MKQLGVVAMVFLAASMPLYADLREQLVKHMGQAQSSIDVVVYEIHSDEIADALIEAKRRGVSVRVIVDAVHSPVASVQEQALEDEHITVKRINGSGRKLLHDKFILFDGTLASTPSYNRSAKSLRGQDADEPSFTRDKNLIAQLKTQFDDVWKSADNPNAGDSE